jgi:hypothetical protein
MVASDARLGAVIMQEGALRKKHNGTKELKNTKCCLLLKHDKNFKI